MTETNSENTDPPTPARVDLQWHSPQIPADLQDAQAQEVNHND